MSRSLVRASLLLLPLFAAAIAACAGAQGSCPGWSHGFQLPGLGFTYAGNDFPRELFVHDDGNGPAIYAGGADWADGAPVDGLARWDGITWSKVGVDFDGDARAFATFDDGTGRALYVAGEIAVAGAPSANRVARWNGSTWSTLGGEFDGALEALAVFDDGSGRALYAAGAFTTAGGAPANHVARWTGVDWAPLGVGTDAAVLALCAFDDGSGPALFAGGQFSSAGGVETTRIARWNGASWSALSSGTNGDVLALTTHDDGTGRALYAGGMFNTAGGVSALSVARWDGSAWSALGIGPNYFVHALQEHDDGSGNALYASGEFLACGAIPTTRIARWRQGAWSALTDGVNVYQEASALAEFDDGTGTALYVCGDIRGSGPKSFSGIGRWDGAAWSAVGNGQGANGLVLSMTVHDDGSGPALYASGQFTQIGGVYGSPQVVRFDGASWSSITPGYSAIANTFVEFDDGAGPALYMAGGFALLGAGSQSRMAKWDGNMLIPLAVEANNAIGALAAWDDGTGTALYAGGLFTSIGGIAANRIARWDGVSWSALGSGLEGFASSQVAAMRAFDDGTGSALYVVGSFQFCGGIPANAVARWNGTSWNPVGSTISSGIGLQLAVFDAGAGAQLFIGGRFYGLGLGSTGQGVLRWTGSGWGSIGATTALGYDLWRVTALGVHDFGEGAGAELCAGGNFATFGAPNAASLARWDGGSWKAVGGGITSFGTSGDFGVMALESFDDGSGASLFAGGNIERAQQSIGGPVVRSDYIARWRSCAESGRRYCFGDGTGAACPCGNASAPGADAGCLNSLALAGTLRARGHAGVTHDTLALDASGMPGASALCFQGTARIAGGAGIVFGDGLRCVGGTLVRLSIESGAGGSASYPGVGDPPVSTQGAVGAPSTRSYQVWYRNAAPDFCTPSTFNLTNAVEVFWSL